MDEEDFHFLLVPNFRSWKKSVFFFFFFLKHLQFYSSSDKISDRNGVPKTNDVISRIR